jgi:hypothetical protein
MMQIDGYMITVWWDASQRTLRARGTTKIARVALLGEQHTDGDLVLARDQITQVRHRPAGALVNGSITLHTTAGRKHILHFRRKHNDDFARLAQALG